MLYIYIYIYISTIPFLSTCQCGTKIGNYARERDICACRFARRDSFEAVRFLGEQKKDRFCCFDYRTRWFLMYLRDIIARIRVARMRIQN